MEYIVIKSHRSEYPEPICLKKGEIITIGEEYEGPEDWKNWHFCTTPTHPGGWVPAQIIELLDASTGKVMEDYNAFELDVDAGERLRGLRELNGWVWCQSSAKSLAGWVPLENLEPVQE